VPTSAECWHRAETLVQLAAAATQLYAREMLLEREAEFRQMARINSPQVSTTDDRAIKAMDFRRPGRPLVFGPDILNHAVVGLRPGLKQSNPWPGPREKEHSHPLHLAASTPLQSGVALRAAF
jgi:hypothetical protein